MVKSVKLEASDHYGYDNEKNNLIDSDKIATIQSIGDKIATGANAFLF